MTDSAAVMRRVRRYGTLTDQKALAYPSKVCHTCGWQEITCPHKNTTVTQRAPRKSILPILPCHSAESYTVSPIPFAPELMRAAVFPISLTSVRQRTERGSNERPVQDTAMRRPTQP